MSNRAAAWISVAILALAIAITGTDRLRAPVDVDRCAGPGRFTVSSGEVPILLDTCSGSAWQAYLDIPEADVIRKRWRAMPFGVAKADESLSVTDFRPSASMMAVLRHLEAPPPTGFEDLAPARKRVAGFEDLAPGPSAGETGKPSR